MSCATGYHLTGVGTRVSRRWPLSNSACPGRHYRIVRVAQSSVVARAHRPVQQLSLVSCSTPHGYRKVVRALLVFAMPGWVIMNSDSPSSEASSVLHYLQVAFCPEIDG